MEVVSPILVQEEDPLNEVLDGATLFHGSECHYLGHEVVVVGGGCEPFCCLIDCA